jgi:hypothetical protein
MDTVVLSKAVRFMATILLAACGGSSQPASVTLSPSPSSTASAPEARGFEPPVNALVATTCGPTDGPATTVIVATQGTLGCDDWSKLGSRSRVVIETWDLLRLEPGMTERLPGSHGGAVRMCSGECSDVRAATLRVDEVTADGFRGKLDVKTAGGVLQQRIQARRCELHQMCG